jgi:hypothetical protein
MMYRIRDLFAAPFFNFLKKRDNFSAAACMASTISTTVSLLVPASLILFDAMLYTSVLNGISNYSGYKQDFAVKILSIYFKEK